MGDRRQLRRSRSQGFFHGKRPDDIYIQNLNTLPPPPPDELILTPELMFDGEEESVSFSVRSSPVPYNRSPGPHSAIESPRNFFLEKPPANWKSSKSPISPGVTVLLSPASNGEATDWDSMDFFQAATYSGPRTLQIAAEKKREVPRPVDVKKNTSRVSLPSPKTPKAWPSIVAPDVDTLPSREVVQRNILEASTKLAGQIAQNKKPPDSGQTRHPSFENPLQAYLVAPQQMPGQQRTRSPPPEIKQTRKPPERGQSRSPPIDHRRKLDIATNSLPVNRQQTRLPSNEASSLRSTRSQRSIPEPASAISRTISRTPSPVFDFEESEVTDIESGTECEDGDEDRLSVCETLSSQDPNSPMFDRPPEPKEADWKFHIQQDCAMGGLGALESPSMFSSVSQTPSNITQKTNLKLDCGRTPVYLNDHTKHGHIRRPRQISAESSSRFPVSPIIPPPRRRSPPIIAPIHRDEIGAHGAPFEPDHRPPKNLVSTWLAGISHAGRKEPPREHEVVGKKSRIWGRKARSSKPEGWI